MWVQIPPLVLDLCEDKWTRRLLRPSTSHLEAHARPCSGPRQEPSGCYGQLTDELPACNHANDPPSDPTAADWQTRPRPASRRAGRSGTSLPATSVRLVGGGAVAHAPT